MTRYARRGTSAVFWLPACATLTAPTVTETGAGTDLSDDLHELDGWELQSSTITVGGHQSTFRGTVPGVTAAPAAPSLTFYDDPSTTTVRGLLAARSSGFIVLSPDGPLTVGARCHVWPVTARGPVDDWTTTARPALFVVVFDLDGRPKPATVTA